MRPRDCLAAVLALTFLATAAPSANGQTGPDYHVTRKIKIGGDGGFDYITADPARKRVFLTHATPGGRAGRAPIIPGSFMLLIVSP